MIIDSGQHAPVEPVMPNQMAELADHRRVCCSFIANINAREVTHGGALMTAVFGLRVRHFEALLQGRYAQHALKPDRRAGSFARGVMGRNQSFLAAYAPEPSCAVRLAPQTLTGRRS